MPETAPTFSNPEFGTRDYATAGLTSAGVNANLGKRNQVGLQNSFTSSPVLNGQYTANEARRVFQEYSGQNPEFAMYRRDFMPQEDSRDEYQSPRDKELTPEQIQAARLGTPFSPTTASPGAGNGFNYRTLAAGDTVRGLVPAAAGDTAVNPANEVYRNRGADPGIATGKVRVFKLGVGSEFGEQRTIPVTTT